MHLEEAKQLIESAVSRRELCIAIGGCSVEYFGRAASKLAHGKRMLLIKGDGSFGIHQNRKLNAVNYMIGAQISCSLDKHLLVQALKTKPKESMKVFFDSVEFLQSFPMEEKEDLRLFGSEKELSDTLMNDLSFIEEGLVPMNREEWMRRGFADIVARDSKGCNVVVEVKRRQADYHAVQQLERYMRQIENRKGAKARGILLAPSIGDNARKLLEQYGLEFARLDFEISNPAAKIKGVEKKQKTLFG
ncbi:MAG: endonuclease NucS [Candidatus Diapherotrites archaeon]